MGLINLHKNLVKTRINYDEDVKKAFAPIEKILPDEAVVSAYDHYDYFRMSILKNWNSKAFEKFTVGTAVIEIDKNLNFDEDFKNEILERIKNIL